MEGATVEQPLAKYLVVDTAGFIKNAPLQKYGEIVITLREVIDEIRDKDTKQRLQALPYELKFMDPDCEAISRVSEFTKKTGDFGSLSATDIKVMAMAYTLEARHVGTDHLKTDVKMQKSVEFYNPNKPVDVAKPVVGFYHPEGSDGEENDREESAGEVNDREESKGEVDNGDESYGDESDGEESDGEESDGEESDGWITPANLRAKKLEMLAGDGEENAGEVVAVACMTTDFAMQNVLRQIGLEVLSPDGTIIRRAKTWILRCYACYATWPRVDKLFCPKCGNKTLKRVSVTLNADGSQQIHISKRKPLSSRGKKFSLPKPKGGKYAVNPVLTADQRMPQQRLTALARSKTDVLNSDHAIGTSPFAKRDVNSRSAMLGVASGPGNCYWAHKNPNAVGKKTGNRKKRNRN